MFSNLRRLESLHRHPVIKTSSGGPDFGKCAELLADVYKAADTESLHSTTFNNRPNNIPPISVEEISIAIKCMRKGKAPDRQGVLIEMLLHAGESVLQDLAIFYNGIIQTGIIPETWRESFFTLLHKGGDSIDPNNWRPIAVLSIPYKLLARIVFNRIRGILDAQQSQEQFGFQKKRSTSDAMIVAESLISQSLEFNVDLWLVSVDLRKAFDRVEHGPLFEALQRQGLPACYIHLLRAIYKDQYGLVGDNLRFPITRGVRQGDVLSPLLFNCVLEDAMRMWKEKLNSHGVATSDDDAGNRLTNVRFADDLLLFARSLEEAISMLDMLTETLKAYGLELNVKKTKILSTTVTQQDTVLVDSAEGFVEVVAASRSHKYLGRAWPGNLRIRGQVALDHRMACAWAKFRSLSHSLTNKHVNIKLRLKLFNATVTPAATYCLETCPLTRSQLNQLDIVQRRMLRRMVGWVMDSEDSWEDAGRRMKHRLASALNQHHVECWSGVIEHKKKALLQRLLLIGGPVLPQIAFRWSPISCAKANQNRPYRSQGHPRRRWHDGLA